MVGYHSPYDPAWPRPAGSRRRAKAPFGLRLAVWATAVLVVAGGALLWVNHQYPSLLRSTTASGTQAAAATTPTTAPAPTKRGGSSSPGVVLTQSGPASADVTVSSDQYTVVVSAQAACWVQVAAPGGGAPQFDSVMRAGSQQTFHPTNGQMAMNLGASKVTVAVLIGSGHNPSWQWSPTDAPFQLSFTSTSD